MHITRAVWIIENADADRALFRRRLDERRCTSGGTSKQGAPSKAAHRTRSGKVRMRSSAGTI